MKKSVSLLLTVLMAMSIITVAATSVSAAETAKENNKDCYVGQKVVILTSYKLTVKQKTSRVN